MTSIGLVGLSAKDATSWAVNAHLPYLAKSADKYRIVALQNTSKAAAESAIKRFELPAGTRAYGTPEEVANDPNVELVVISTRVDQHYAGARPSIVAGKNIFVEWPLASSTEQARELLELAKKSGSQIIVGLQGHHSPYALKIKQLLEEGRIGKVLASNLQTYGFSDAPDGSKLSWGYHYDRSVGGNLVSIIGGHLLHTVHSVLGEFQSLSANGQILWPQANLRDATSGAVVESVPSSVPDQVFISGTLLSGAHLTVNLNRAPPFKGTPTTDWRILGDKGAIRLSSLSNMAFSAFNNDLKIELEDYASGTVKEVPVDLTFPDLPVPAQNVAALYEAVARGDTTQYADGALALKRHEEVDAIWRGIDSAAA